MTEAADFVLRTIPIGVGATALLDVWALLSTRLLGVPAPNWALVGRWIGYFPRGRFMHENIARTAPVRGELAIGWCAHYAVGIVYAALLVAIWGLDWAHRPTLIPAMIVAIAALAAPFFVMQPGMGAGLAASKTPNPNAARLRSLVAHSVFGLGLYASASLLALVLPA